MSFNQITELFSILKHSVASLPSGNKLWSRLNLYVQVSMRCFWRHRAAILGNKSQLIETFIGIVAKAKGHGVDTVKMDGERIRKYVKYQEQFENKQE